MNKIANSTSNKRIFLSPPHMGGEEISFVQEAFESNYIAPLAPMVDSFENEFAEKVGILYAVAVSSGTADMPLLNTPQLNKSIKAFNHSTIFHTYGAGAVNLAVLRNLTPMEY